MHFYDEADLDEFRNEADHIVRLFLQAHRDEFDSFAQAMAEAYYPIGGEETRISVEIVTAFANGYYNTMAEVD
jgi:hypothetical protein